MASGQRAWHPVREHGIRSESMASGSLKKRGLGLQLWVHVTLFTSIKHTDRAIVNKQLYWIDMSKKKKKKKGKKR